MPVPKRKRSRARINKRFANKGIKVKAIVACPTCQAPVSPHQVCHECGFYKGVKVIRTKKDRLQERNQARQAMAEKMKALETAAAASGKTQEAESLPEKK